MNDEQDKPCFVISEIGEDSSQEREQADWVLDRIIRPAAKVAGYQADRADHIDRPGMITPDVIRSLMEADLIIADLSVPNPNVYYELAIAHAYGRPVVQIRRRGTGLPFDVKDGRTVSFSRDFDDVENARSQIVTQIRAVESDPTDVDNPISLIVKILELSTSGTSESDLLVKILGSIQDLRMEVSTRYPSREQSAAEEQLEGGLERIVDLVMGARSLVYTIRTGESPENSGELEFLASRLEMILETLVDLRGNMSHGPHVTDRLSESAWRAATRSLNIARHGDS